MQQSDPKHYFQFEYPDVGIFPPYILPDSGYEEPFESDIHGFISPYKEPYGRYDENSEYMIKLPQFYLPYKYESTPMYQNTDGFEEDTDKYIYTLSEMTELDVNIAFIRRALEYHNLDLDNDSHSNFVKFLNFHYRRYRFEPSQWLNYISTIFNEKTKDETFIENVGDQAFPIAIISICGIADDWIISKRTELKTLEGNKNEPIEVKSEASEDKIKVRYHKEMIIILHKIGVLDLQMVKKLTPKQRGTLFAHLLGFSEKNTEIYINNIAAKNTDKNPYYAEKINHAENAKKFLEGLNIDNS